MGYQALLFCPDEKLARVVGHVFSELDFKVEPVQEPFAAVKKFMAQRYDAIVVDCENEPNASLLFKSARNSSFNQSSLAIALVEGQAGVAKAYRIGANLVLTKPINVEQAKGTLRVARGLLRKNAEAASAAAPAKTEAPVSAGHSFQPASQGTETIVPAPRDSELPEFEAPQPAMVPAAPSTAIPASVPAMAASAKMEDEPAVLPGSAAQSEIPTEITIATEPAADARHLVAEAEVVNNNIYKSEGIKNEIAKIAAAHVAQKPSSAFTPAQGSAAAPAPAKEGTALPAPAKGKESTIVAFEAAYPSHTDALAYRSASATDAPSFPALGEEGSGRSGGGRKVLVVAVAVLALAALGWELAKFTTSLAPQHATALQASGQPAPAVAPMSSPMPAPTSTPGQKSSATQSVTPKTAIAPLLDKPSGDAANSPVIRIAATPEPGAMKPESSPLQVKSSAGGTKTHTHADESAPQLPSPLAVSSADDNNVSGLMSASPNLPKPSLATLRISQGVSQGLLIKRVQPKYPPAALAARAQGAVQIEATINKEGNVTNLKVLSGDPILAKAALEAVHQWRYKPYYLDGEPVEIQTQITINFKTN